MRTIVAAALLTGLFATIVGGQMPVPRDPVLPTATVGSELFRYYCSACHGLDGRGRPAATAGHATPPDLTTLARRNNGRFPRDEVRAAILNGGSRTSALPGSDMPHWGIIFRDDDGLGSARVESLLDHLQVLQESVHRPQSSN